MASFVLPLPLPDGGKTDGRLRCELQAQVSLLLTRRWGPHESKAAKEAAFEV